MENTDRHAYRHTGWWTDRLVDRQAGGQTGWWTDRLVDRQAGCQTGWLSDRLVDRQAGGLTGWWTDRLADRQMNKQKNGKQIERGKSITYRQKENRLIDRLTKGWTDRQTDGTDK
jgi:hypothetical protein